MTTTATTALPSELAFRLVQEESDLAACTAIETASYPADEAASPQALAYRYRNAGDYFWCATTTTTTADAAARQPLSAPSSKRPGGGGGTTPTNTNTTSSIVVGFVCATRCQSFTGQSMSEHDVGGPLLAVHSVAVRRDHRRRGVGTQMLRAYIRHVASLRRKQEEEEEEATTLRTPSIQKMVLLAKKHLLSFYVNCGFQVIRPSPIVHGRELWYELEQDLPSCVPKREWSPCFVVDAFGKPGRRGTGNPAAVVLLDDGASDDDEKDASFRSWMQTVAAEFNLSETAFVWPMAKVVNDDGNDKVQNPVEFAIRYYTPTVPVPLCGHATLASASVLYQTGRVPTDRTVTFCASQDTVLSAATVDGDATHISMSFPLLPASEITEQSSSSRKGLETMLRDGFGLTKDQIVWMGVSPGVGDVLVQVSSPDWLRSLTHADIDFDALVQWDGYTRGIILTSQSTSSAGRDAAAANAADFGSRFFAPKAGIREDPVTGSAHAVLVPHFAATDHKTEFVAEQWSPRGGWLTCALKKTNKNAGGDGQVVEIAGRAVTTLKGNLQ